MSGAEALYQGWAAASSAHGGTLQLRLTIAVGVVTVGDGTCGNDAVENAFQLYDECTTNIDC